MTAPTTADHLRAEGILKLFGAIPVLRGASIRVPRGEIEGLVGHNGAGKSTLISIVSGSIDADAGAITLDGVDVARAGVAELERRGLVLVPQQTSVFERLSVLDNLLIPRRFPLRGRTSIRWTDARRLARTALARVELAVDPDRTVSTLSIPARRRLMIARALLRQPQLLILDEPTEAFAETEVSQLFELLRQLVAAGMTMVYVSHRLDEVLEIADHVTIMRQGATVGRLATAGLSRTELLGTMLGEAAPVVVAAESDRPARRPARRPVLALDRVSTRKLMDVSIAVNADEVVGVYGLAGSGRTELLRAIAGATPLTAGRIELHEEPVAPSLAARRRQGISYQPQDTASHAALPRLTVRENVAIAVHGGVRARPRIPVVSRRREASLTNAALRRVGLGALRSEVRLETLSGGMQQRVMMARSLVAGASLWLLDEPTTGLDVRSRLELAALLRELVSQPEADDRASGALVVLSDYDDLCVMCDRVYTLRDGCVTGVFAAGEFSEHDLLHAVSFEAPVAA